MPVFSGGGRVAAAVEVTVPEASSRDAITAGLTVACRSLSRQLATENAHRLKPSTAD